MANDLTSTGYPSGFGGLATVMLGVNNPVPQLAGITEPPRGLIFTGATVERLVIQTDPLSGAPLAYGMKVTQVAQLSPSVQEQLDAVVALAAPPYLIEQASDPDIELDFAANNTRAVKIVHNGTDVRLIEPVGLTIGQRYSVLIEVHGDGYLFLNYDYWGIHPTFYLEPPSAGYVAILNMTDTADVALEFVAVADNRAAVIGLSYRGA